MKTNERMEQTVKVNKTNQIDSESETETNVKIKALPWSRCIQQRMSCS